VVQRVILILAKSVHYRKTSSALAQ